jgi:predicted PurR-regulated permease PerM
MNNRKYILLGLGLAVTVLVIWFFSAIFFYLVAAAVLALLGRPFVKWYSRIKIGKSRPSPALCALGAMLTIMLIFLSIISVFIPLILDEINILSSIDPQQVLQSFEGPLRSLEDKINSYNTEPGQHISIESYVQQKLAEVFSFARVSEILNAIISVTGSLFVAFFAISFMTFFFLKDESLIYDTVQLLVPQKHSRTIRVIMLESQELLERYFIGVCIEIALVTFLIAIGLYAFGIKNALIIAFFAGIINIIPYIGPLIGASFGIFIALSTNLHLDFYSGMLPIIGKVAGVFIVVLLLDGTFLQPTIYSNTVKAHPLEIFLVIMIAGSLAGIPGMIMAIPAYTIIRVIAKEFFFNFRIVRKLTEDLEEID